MKMYRIVNRTKFYLFVIFIIYASFSILFFFKSSGRAENVKEINMVYKIVHILEGDTLWNIALKYKPDKYDVRDMVAEIRDFNQLEDISIKPGDIIKVPLRKK